MKRMRGIVSAAGVVLLLTSACAQEPPPEPQQEDVSRTPKLLVELPEDFNAPDGADVDSDGNIFLSSPNFSNDHLLETGVIQEPAPPAVARIDAHNQVSTWYTFAAEDMHPATGRIGPMDIALGPDGHLYVADMQLLWDPGHKSRLLRINVENGQPVGMDVVVEGFIVANGMVWKGDTLFVTESVLAHPAPVEEGEEKPPLVSGVYAFTLDELQGETIQLTPYSEEGADSRLLLKLESGNTMGFGADGVTVASDGHLYTSVVEDGRLYKTTLSDDNQEIETVLFAEGMKSADGIIWNPGDDTIYVADLLNNAVHGVDMEGNVSTVHQNGDTDGADGALDQPVEVALRGNELIIVNMDLAWLLPPGVAVNTVVDRPYSVSVIELE